MDGGGINLRTFHSHAVAQPRGITIDADRIYIADAATRTAIAFRRPVIPAVYSGVATPVVRDPAHDWALPPDPQGLTIRRRAGHPDEYYCTTSNNVYQCFKGGLGPARDRITDAWDKDKLCLVRNAPVDVAEDTAKDGYTSVMSIGHAHPIQSYTRTADAYDASIDLDANTVVVPIMRDPGRRIHEIRLFISAANISNMADLEIGMYYATGGYTGSTWIGNVPAYGNEFASAVLPAASLTRQMRSLTGSWITVPIDYTVRTVGT